MYFFIFFILFCYSKANDYDKAITETCLDQVNTYYFLINIILK